MICAKAGASCGVHGSAHLGMSGQHVFFFMRLGCLQGGGVVMPALPLVHYRFEAFSCVRA